MEKTKMNTLLLMALTYRLSDRVLQEDYQISLEELETFYAKEDAISLALYHLKNETAYEPSRMEEDARKEAQAYWMGRKKLIQEYNELARTNASEEQLNLAKKRYLLWQEKINDKPFKRILGKHSQYLSDEEKRCIVCYRLKYGLTLFQLGQILHYHKNTVLKIEREVLDQDPNLLFKVNRLTDANNYHGKTTQLQSFLENRTRF